MIRKIQHFIENKNLFSKDNNLLLAISGGAGDRRKYVKLMIFFA